ncbi:MULTISPECIES: 30S ribosomal protein S12 methylthiotransferase RimO [unclassified Devosia]|uniref:30S ribosomal protein S12 methylthiotransferase RimO n=1 Tax=unclassified Devosia TaxID=196773 RepID=UPI0008694ED0|nr:MULTISPECIES: 30S ribosomal protein S12 methylthiotransferase RimO [unclassified Devosia]MBN9361545.1 30S ribosomal protein S12 methylthiotransferase RimO [Devosia sp.]ODS95185.1 MAG: ribosomal protein S12 methylthiotransferase [Devosia sp. SCN 66-27]OJX26604.1 MAG: ribosomal protein S12 methylthiotransferase [Devosia sp. 66-14]
MTQAPKIGLVSLGCPKALVDSERIMTTLRSQGYSFSRDYAGADVVLVNTCGFLDSAKKESLEAIGEAVGANGRVIVTGCLGVEEEMIRATHPSVLAVTGPHQYEDVVNAVNTHVPPVPNKFVDLVPEAGLKLTPRHYAYMKISEGCNNRCTFCIIPQIRGDLASRPIASVLYEAERLVATGVKEIMVISQDTSAYGLDIKYQSSKFRGRDIEARFQTLAEELGKMDVWTRLHYVYPYPHVDSVIPLMAEGKILPYLDIPFQHAAPSVLKAMRRPANQVKTLDRIKAWRAVAPDLAIRSNFIVGFPGETEEDFEFLLDWLEEAEIDRIGCFEYEPVTGAPANDIEGIVPDELKRERYERLMEVAQDISAHVLSKKVGRTIDVLVDDVEPDTGRAIGRSQWDAPEIDGTVIIHEADGIKVGDKLSVLVTDSDEYDLFAVPSAVAAKDDSQSAVVAG